MPTMRYFRVLDTMTTGNLGKIIVPVVKVRHICLPFILYFLTTL